MSSSDSLAAQAYLAKYSHGGERAPAPVSLLQSAGREEPDHRLRLRLIVPPCAETNQRRWAHAVCSQPGGFGALWLRERRALPAFYRERGELLFTALQSFIHPPAAAATRFCFIEMPIKPVLTLGKFEWRESGDVALRHSTQGRRRPSGSTCVGPACLRDVGVPRWRASPRYAFTANDVTRRSEGDGESRGSAAGRTKAIIISAEGNWIPFVSAAR